MNRSRAPSKALLTYNSVQTLRCQTRQQMMIKATMMISPHCRGRKTLPHRLQLKVAKCKMLWDPGWSKNTNSNLVPKDRKEKRMKVI